jgi:YHS domain-containing protein
MFLRWLLISIILTIVVRAFGRVVDEFKRGLRGDAPPPNTRVPQQSVHMARDPVCGTFVVPERAVFISDGRQRVYFCSTVCRDKYRPSTGSGRARTA